MRSRHLGAAAVAVAVLAAGLLLPSSSVAAVTPATTVSAAGHGTQIPDPDHLTIVSVSNPHPDLISGEQALLRISSPRSDRGRGLRVTVNGRSVTSAFKAQPDGSAIGLVAGLHQGRNEVFASRGRDAARLTLTDHSITGPVFSGKQQQPFYCETSAYGLAPAVQPLCSAPTVVSYQYRTTAGTFAALPNPASRPADLANTTVNGHPVPYIVRLETGTIDRAVYQTAALYDGRAPSPYRPDSSWNSKLVYTFGGGCNGGYHQGNATGGVLDDLFLSQGYAVASSSLNVLDNNCSTIISAEAAMMVKEHFIDTYGPVLHTIGWGGSGGAMQQYDIADAYPGILDGIVPGVSFPDPLTVLGPVTDCRLLNTFFDGSGAAYSAAAQLAVEGFPTTSTCRSWDATFASRATATQSCNAAIPVSAIWNPLTNPSGIKCSANEQLVNQFGRDPKTGFVRSTLDNTGVQYGLAALRAGQLTAAEFAQLNAEVGGQDYTGTPSAKRTAADPKALRAAYADDLINSASLGLRTTPIIDQRTDLDFARFGNDIHTTQWSFIMRARLEAANGTSANQVIIENQPTPDQIAAANIYELAAMDKWLGNIATDRSARSKQQKVIDDKPAGLGDGCYLTATQRVLQPLTYPASGQCGSIYPIGADTRLAVGESTLENVLKCRLQPLNFAAYAPVRFTAAEKAQLRSAFPQGVCDYSRPGVGQHRPVGTWINYSHGR